MTDVQQARIEAAARRMWRDRNGTIKSHDSVRTRESDEAEIDATGYGAWDAPKRISNAVKEHYRTIASNALQAADAAVTVEMIVDELAGHPIGSGYYQTTVSVDEAREMAEAVQALIKKED